MVRNRMRIKNTRTFLPGLVVAIAIFCAFACRGTVDRCPNVAPPREQRQAIQQVLEGMANKFPAGRPAGSVTIPVYFHVLTTTNGAGNVTDEAIALQIQALNYAFAGSYTPFKFYWAGTDRTPNDAWFNMSYEENPSQEERDAKRTLNRPGNGVLNIYTAGVAGDIYGWGRFPWKLADGVDGVVVRYSTLPGGSEYPYNLGDTATHEVGHWLGLYHTYEGNCGPPGDEIDDTPPGKDKATGCPNNWDSCPQTPYYDAVHNFMNATTDACMREFTRRQSERMDNMHRAYRS